MNGSEDRDTRAGKPGFLRRMFGGVLPFASEPPEPEPETEAGAPASDALSPAADSPEGARTTRLDDDPPEGASAGPASAPSDDGAPADARIEASQGKPPGPAGRDAPAAVAPVEVTSGGTGWWTRLRAGLARSSSSITRGIADVFTKRKLDAASLEDLEDVLIRADLGLALATRMTATLAGGRYEKGIEPSRVQEILAREVEAVLSKVAVPLAVDLAIKPFVVLVVGVNGSGKTTTIGKLAHKLVAEGRSVTLGAGDTFRAAAIEQLKVWGQRTGSPVVSRDQGSDAAGLVFDAMTTAKANGSDVLLIDTAGRLQNRTELMDELGKVIRVMRKVDSSAPHAVLLVLDATVGQNALSQVETFARVAGVTGLVMTKLDGTARGGILVAIAERFGLPVHFIGVGEGLDDLEPFAAADFARAIAGLDAD